MSESLDEIEIVNTGYSLKASENLIRNLEKENFNLKLKIFLMEQRYGISSQYPNPKTENERLIVDILEQNQSLKFQLSEKQSLLENALDAIEYLETSNENYQKSSKNQQSSHNSIIKAKSINIRSFNVERKISKLARENYKKFKVIEKLTSLLINSSINSKEVEQLQLQISSLKQKIMNLEAEKNHREEIINEQNYLMKALNRKIVELQQNESKLS